MYIYVKLQEEIKLVDDWYEVPFDKVVGVLLSENNYDINDKDEWGELEEGESWMKFEMRQHWDEDILFSKEYE